MSTSTLQNLAAVIFVAIPIMMGFLGARVFGGGETDWYKTLNKAPWTPPGWAFPIVWMTLYFLMGISSWLVWTEGGFEEQALPLSLYFFHLVLNFLWTPLFFNLHRVDLALVEIVFLWAAVLALVLVFWPVSHLASYLLYPYILWVSIAVTLNAYIFFNNDFSSQPLLSEQ